MRHHRDGDSDRVGCMLKVIAQGLNETMKKFEGLKQHITQKALVSALNKTATQGRNYSIRKIRQGYIIESGYLKEKLKIEKATKNKLTATIVAKREGKPLLVTRFSARMTKKGISVKVKRTGGRTTISRAFIVTMGGVDVPFRRTKEYTVPTKGRYKGKIKTRNTKRGARGEHLTREAVETIKGPSIADLFGYEEIYKDVEKFTGAKLVEVFLQELRYYTKKYFPNS